jgi:5,10-methylene-tetrahydrofolate dehydrogenase/methenyl tetrahydrofolate cyclohydrolase
MNPPCAGRVTEIHLSQLLRAHGGINGSVHPSRLAQEVLSCLMSEAVQGREPAFTPCTPLGCIQLLDRTGITIAGKRAAVIGRSNIVGIPVAMLLNKRDATVTICHSRTAVRSNLSTHTQLLLNVSKKFKAKAA